MTESNHPSSKREGPLLPRVPWEKAIVWGLFIVALYLVRHLFFVILMTFLFCYVVRAIVGKATRVLSPGVERAWLERVLAAGCFIVLLAGLVLLVRVLGPRAIVQAEALVGRFSKIDAEQDFQQALDKTVGAYFFHREFGDPNDPRFKAELEKRLADGAVFAAEYHEFPSVKATIESDFDAHFARARSAGIRGTLLEHGFDSPEFAQWLAARHPSGDEKPPSTAAATEDRAAASVLDELRQDPAQLGKLYARWKDIEVANRLAQLRASPAYLEEFRRFFEERRAQSPAALPFDFETYRKLDQAYPKGEKAFAQALGRQATDDEAARIYEQESFRRSVQHELAANWWRDSPTALFVRHHVSNNLDDLSAQAAGHLRGALSHALTVPVQLGMALLLSFFIMIDFSGLRMGAARLRQSRLGGVYDEITPGLARLGRLVGASFYAQGIIAACNALLTFVALIFLGVDHALTLAVTVFVCSFIPVIGIVLSSLPIAIVALVQPGGSITLALYALLAVVVIHLIESSILSPRIVGRYLHLHPVLVFVVLLVAEHFFGFWGLLLGVPVAVFLIGSALPNHEPREERPA